MAPWPGHDYQDRYNFGDVMSDFGHSADFGDLGLIWVVILLISVIWHRFGL